MVDSIVTKRRNTPASQQHKAVISAQTRDLAMGNGLGMAHECLLALRDIGEHYAQSPFSDETMRAFVLDWSTSAADGASCVADILDPNQKDGPVGAERNRLLGVHTHAEKSSETMKRLHDFFYKDHGAHLQAMDHGAIGNLILGMVKPAGIHLERAIKLLGYDGGGYTSFTSEFPEAASILSEAEPASVSHATESAVKKHGAAADAILEAHGTLLALRDLGKQMDVWPCQLFTLGSAMMPMTAKVEADLEAVEKALPQDAPKDAMVNIGLANARAESMSFMAKHLIYAGSAEYDNQEEDNKEHLLACFGGCIDALVFRIGFYLDRACDVIDAQSSKIALDE
jgi:hypothetical protein